MKDGFCLGAPGEENPETRYCLVSQYPCVPSKQDWMFYKQHYLVLSGTSHGKSKEPCNLVFLLFQRESLPLYLLLINQ